MDPQVLTAINVFFLVTFVVLLVLAVARIFYRYTSYKKEGLKIPALLHRDGFFLTGLAVPFLGVLFFRVLGINASEQDWYIFWVLGSGTFALAGTAYWVYMEYFKIEK